MAVIICPECGAENTPGDEDCWSCQAALTGVEPVDAAEKDKIIRDDFGESINPEEDLPGLFHALKQEGKMGVEQQDADTHEGQSNSLDEDNLDQSDPEGEIPEWLRRIRQRAKHEKDSVGEVTQKISAAQDSLSEEKQYNRHESYAEWIERLRQESPQKRASEDSDGDASTDEAGQPSQTEEPEWLTKIRKVQGKPVEEQGPGELSAEGLGGDSLLQWLVDLENGKEKLVPLSEKDALLAGASGDSVGELDQEEFPADGDTTQEIHIKKQAADKPVLSISREEQLEADQLAATIVDETAARAVHKPEKHGAGWLIRLAVTVILITAISFSLFSGSASSSRPASLKPQHQALISWMSQLPAESRLLLVVDYHAGFDREISLIAQPILAKAFQATTELVLLASTESGVLLAEELLQGVDGIENLVVSQAGYLPASNYVAFGLGLGHDTSWRFIHVPEDVNPFPQGIFEGVIVLSDSYEGGRIWIEQIYARFHDVPLILITAAQAGPLLLPYFESQQLVGLVSGLSEARQITAYLNIENSTGQLWEAYRVGVLMMIIVIVLGLFLMSGQDDNDPKDSQGGKL